jgi:hypothetical protein
MFTSHKKLFIIVMGIVIVSIVAVLVVLLLNQTKSITPSTKPIASKDIVIALRETLKAGATKSYIFQEPAPENHTNIFVNSTTSSTVLLTTTTNFVTFSKNSVVSSDELDNLKTTVTSYLTKNGFTEAKTINTTTILLRFGRADADCQLSRFAAEGDKMTTFELACIDRIDASEKLKQIDSLLALWTKRVTFDYISQDSISDATYELRIISAINIVNPGKSHRLLFINDKGTWKYIGDANEGDLSQSNGKFIINDDIKKALSDPGYGGLVSKYIPTTKK